MALDERGTRSVEELGDGEFIYRNRRGRTVGLELQTSPKQLAIGATKPKRTSWEDGEADVITYNSSLNACANAAQWTMAVELWASMLEQKIQPTLISCNSLMDACRRANLMSCS